MPMNARKLHALDFDGVICDSAVETAITGWKAARPLWADMPAEVPREMIARFREVRPVIETGYEAILAMRLLFLGETVAAIYQDHGVLFQALLAQIDGGVDSLKQLFGATRDRWITEDLADWVAMNPLFPGIAEKLRQLPDFYIITTKQERFVKQILDAHAIAVPGERIFGLDRHLSKPEVLRQLLLAHPDKTLVFVEDRLPTLSKVIDTPELAGVKLIFALWGYNTPADQARAESLPVCSQTLDGFLAD